jgi:hypothetical protein
VRGSDEHAASVVRFAEGATVRSPTAAVTQAFTADDDSLCRHENQLDGDSNPGAVDAGRLLTRPVVLVPPVTPAESTSWVASGKPAQARHDGSRWSTSGLADIVARWKLGVLASR